LVSLQIEVKEQLLANNLDRNALKKIKEKYVGYINKYPHVSDGYAQLGAVQILLEEFPESLVSLIKAKELAMPHQMQAGLYRNFVIAYFENGKYNEAYEAAGMAIGFQKYVTDDKFFMYSLAKTEASLGKYEDAQTALKVIAAKVPNIKSDPDFIESVDYVFDKMKDKK
jgi:tetratricopeptide (TPR) repeat protein